uniref:Uncharacterized protein n=1 Tax=Cacopsylla melanoneura TaxID=428564 RepID=A0A8D8W4Z9_9HEMI
MYRLNIRNSQNCGTKFCPFSLVPHSLFFYLVISSFLSTPLDVVICHSDPLLFLPPFTTSIPFLSEISKKYAGISILSLFLSSFIPYTSVLLFLRFSLLSNLVISHSPPHYSSLHYFHPIIPASLIFTPHYSCLHYLELCSASISSVRCQIKLIPLHLNAK